MNRTTTPNTRILIALFIGLFTLSFNATTLRAQEDGEGGELIDFLQGLVGDPLVNAANGVEAASFFAGGGILGAGAVLTKLVIGGSVLSFGAASAAAMAGFVVGGALAIGIYAAIKWWQKKQHDEDQAQVENGGFVSLIGMESNGAAAGTNG